MLRYDRLELVNVEVGSTRILLLNKILALAIFDGPIQSGFDQLSQDLTNSVSNIGGGVLHPPPPGAIPEKWYCIWNLKCHKPLQFCYEKRIIVILNHHEEMVITHQGKFLLQ